MFWRRVSGIISHTSTTHFQNSLQVTGIILRARKFEPGKILNSIFQNPEYKKTPSAAAGISYKFEVRKYCSNYYKNDPSLSSTTYK